MYVRWHSRAYRFTFRMCNSLMLSYCLKPIVHGIYAFHENFHAAIYSAIIVKVLTGKHRVTLFCGKQFCAIYVHGRKSLWIIEFFPWYYRISVEWIYLNHLIICGTTKLFTWLWFFCVVINLNFYYKNGVDAAREPTLLISHHIFLCMRSCDEWKCILPYLHIWIY